MRLKKYEIETFDGIVYCHFLTSASNSKDALLNLINNSTDYAKIVKANNNINIKVTKLK